MPNSSLYQNTKLQYQSGEIHIIHEALAEDAVSHLQRGVIAVLGENEVGDGRCRVYVVDGLNLFIERISVALQLFLEDSSKDSTRALNRASSSVVAKSPFSGLHRWRMVPISSVMETIFLGISVKVKG